jgi:predicted nucleic-acid-binding Zn-ribbon protein
MKHKHDYRSDGRTYCYCIKCGKNKYEEGNYYKDKMTSKNKKQVIDFYNYCIKNSNLRFWQALRNWAKVKFIYISNKKYNVTYPEIKDTFYFEGRNK